MPAFTSTGTGDGILARESRVLHTAHNVRAVLITIIDSRLSTTTLLPAPCSQPTMNTTDENWLPLVVVLFDVADLTGKFTLIMAIIIVCQLLKK